MTSETWKKLLPPVAGPSPVLDQHRPETAMERRESVDSKMPRAFTKALRTLSSSSLDSLSTVSTRNGSTRRLQKTNSNPGPLFERLHRRVSKGSGTNSPPSEGPGTTSEQVCYSAMEILRYGPLRVDVSLLKARSEYLVLSEHCLVRFGSVEAARGTFPQLLTQPDEAQAGRSPMPPSVAAKAGASEMRFEVPLRSVVAAFSDDASGLRCAIEIWWLSPWPRLAYCKVRLNFALPNERDDWLGAIQTACRARTRKLPANSMVPENLKTRINHIVATTEPTLADGLCQNLTFPVVKRKIGAVVKAHNGEEGLNVVETSSFYLAIGTCMCYFIEVLKAEHMTKPGELLVKCSSYGTVTLTRFKASVASHEHRFTIGFRSPFGRESRLELASIHYRRVIEALTRVDRILKPMWPQHFQQAIFDIQGLPPPLQLTSGNDLGGLERSLLAYCTAFNVQEPRWTIEWNAPSQAAFRLLPSEGAPYSAAQLLACFRALRYNSFFKALSFRDVDLSALAGKMDFVHHGDTVVYTSLNGLHIADEHHDILMQSPVLSQEMHALMFASESIRSIDLRNVFGSQSSGSRLSRSLPDHQAACARMASELMRPILMLFREQLSVCRSLSLSDNAVALCDVDELSNLLVLDHVHLRKLEMARCCLGDSGLFRLWAGIPGQAASLETIDTSENQGTVKFELIQGALYQLRALKKLRIAGNTRLNTDASLFSAEAISGWELQELDLSGIALNDATVGVLANYLQSIKSRHVGVLRLNRCGLTGHQVARLFRGMGQARHMTVHINASRLDDGIDDLCGAIACGFGPWGLFMQMIEFTQETSYIKLWHALTVNKTIECLSMAGSATPDAISGNACQAVSEFFRTNDTVRFLDISGFESKLDEGRLGAQFSTTLIGMRDNAKMEHLRVRSQMLNINIGDLAEAISGNKTLHTLDCEGNDFNLSNFRHLVKHLEDNKTIRYFSAFSEKELAQSIRKSLDPVGPARPALPTRRSSMISRLRYDKTRKHETHEREQGPLDASATQPLRKEWETALANLQRILIRNQKIHENSDQSEDDVSVISSVGGSFMQEDSFMAAFGGLVLREQELKRPSGRGQSSKPARRSSVTKAAGTTAGNWGVSGDFSRFFSATSSPAASSLTSDGGKTESGAGTPPEAIESENHDAPSAEPPSPEPGDECAGSGYYTLGDAGDEDQGLRMKMHRRYQSDPSSRIEEEEDA